ncbi:MAG: hypothetical protein WKF54_03775 [Nocardioidaceae bacterium]
MALVAGLVTLAGFVPTAVSAGSSSGDTQQMQGAQSDKAKGPGWCC